MPLQRHNLRSRSFHSFQRPTPRNILAEMLDDRSVLILDLRHDRYVNRVKAGIGIFLHLQFIEWHLDDERIRIPIGQISHSQNRRSKFEISR